MNIFERRSQSRGAGRRGSFVTTARVLPRADVAPAVPCSQEPSPEDRRSQFVSPAERPLHPSKNTYIII